MDTGPLIVVAALVLLVGAGIAWGRDRSRLRLELAQAQARTEELRARLDSCVHDLEQVTRTSTDDRSTYLITDAGLEKPAPNVPDRLVLSATLGEPLVKVVALGHGLARALSAESRNKIRFEMRREVRRSRKQRRREMKEAWRHRRGEQRAEAGTEAA